jgi:mono/diheme cytochrome c family protein
VIAASDVRGLAARLIPERRAARMAWLAAVVITVGLLLLPAIVRLDGKPHADWLQFVGRFHPLAVHLPIGLIVLVPVLEIAGAFRPPLREAAGFVLALAVVACIGTLILGYLLAYGSGDTGTTVTRHMWGGIALAIGLILCLLARPSWSVGDVPRFYPALLACVMFTLLWTAHQGGSLTHGSTYLTQYMPAPMKRWASLGAVNAAVPAPDSFYAKRIHPIFDSNCVGCHGASKTEGGLRLDSYEMLMKGGKDGPVLLARRAENSLLIQRVTLPVNNQHFMPAEGRPPLKPDQVASIRAWIEQGASPDANTVAGVSMPAEAKEPPIQPVGDYSKFMDEIRQMENSQGAKLLPVSSKPSDGLILNTVDVAANFGDAQLAQFEKFAPYVVEADLARTAVTDASFEILARFTHLRALHLEGTAVTGGGVSRLAPLSQLTYLNLSETKVTAANLSSIRSMPNLRHIYLFNSPAQPAPAAVATAPERDPAQPNTRSTK